MTPCGTAFCAPDRHDDEGICRATDLDAGGKWSVGLTRDDDETPLIHLWHPTYLPVEEDGTLELGVAARLAVAVLRQVARALWSQCRTKWTSIPRHRHATPLGHWHPDPRAGR